MFNIGLLRRLCWERERERENVFEREKQLRNLNERKINAKSKNENIFSTAARE